jgi:hypothetical protein
VFSKCTVYTNEHNFSFWSKEEWIFKKTKKPVDKHKVLIFSNFSILCQEYIFFGICIYGLWRGALCLHHKWDHQNLFEPFCENPDQSFIGSTVLRLIDWEQDMLLLHSVTQEHGFFSFRIWKLTVSSYYCKMSPLGLSVVATARCCLLGSHQNSATHFIMHKEKCQLTAPATVDNVCCFCKGGVMRGSIQTTVIGLLAPEALYLIRTFTVTHYTEQQCCA